MANNNLIYINGVLQHPSTYQYSGNGTVQLTGTNSTMSSNHTISTVTLGNIAAQPLSWLDQLNNITINTGHYKKYDVYEFQEDILAISCAWKRHRDNNPGVFTYSKLTDKELFDTVTSDDKKLAREVRDYYSKKIMMLTLKGGYMTPFRTALNGFIHSEPTRTTDDLFPVIYRLPEFYEYDIKVDDIKMLLPDRPRGAQLEKTIPHGSLSTFSLSPITCLKKQNKRLKVKEYWFRTPSEIPVLIQIEPKNPLEHIWNEIFDTKKVLDITGKSFVKSMDDFEYLSITNWKLNSAT